MSGIDKISIILISIVYLVLVVAYNNKHYTGKSVVIHDGIVTDIDCETIKLTTTCSVKFNDGFKTFYLLRMDQGYPKVFTGGHYKLVKMIDNSYEILPIGYSDRGRN